MGASAPLAPENQCFSGCHALALQGVSVPNPWGLPADQGLQLALALGPPAVVMLDLRALTPLDPTGRSARMAAFVLGAFLQGLATRNR